MFMTHDPTQPSATQPNPTRGSTQPLENSESRQLLGTRHFCTRKLRSMTIFYQAYLVNTGEFHAPILRNEDVSGHYSEDDERNELVGQLDAVVVHLS